MAYLVQSGSFWYLAVERWTVLSLAAGKPVVAEGLPQRFEHRLGTKIQVRVLDDGQVVLCERVFLTYLTRCGELHEDLDEIIEANRRGGETAVEPLGFMIRPNYPSKGEVTILPGANILLDAEPDCVAEPEEAIQVVLSNRNGNWSTDYFYILARAA